MPTVLRKAGHRFFFFSNEGNEPPHIHVESGAGYAKFWLNTVRLVYSSRLTQPELAKLLKLVSEYQFYFNAPWHEYFY